MHGAPLLLPLTSSFLQKQVGESMKAERSARPKAAPELLVGFFEEFGWLETKFRDVVKDAAMLESVCEELDAHLEALTPEACFDRVMLQLECVGDVSLLRAALGDAQELRAATSPHSELGVNEIPRTRRFFTLREKARATAPAPARKSADGPTTAAARSRAGGSDMLQSVAQLEVRYGSPEAIVARVRALEAARVEKEKRIAALSERLMARIKRKLSWLGDIVLLQEALDRTQMLPTEPATRSEERESTDPSHSTMRQLVLFETTAAPAPATSPIDVSATGDKTEELEVKTAENGEKEGEPEPDREDGPARPPGRIAGKKRRERGQSTDSSEGDEAVEDGQEESAAKSHRPTTRSMGAKELWP
ncbi:hypothetical protein BBJ28_00005280 [Nothophytophthora sp. Chile5]|nr:hypothetical protein BBJ28_00005280 [Nothophytophthora sp. Chile5]